MKISKIITECIDCDHLVIADNRRENKSSFAICMHPDINPFLITNSQVGDVKSSQLTIPSNCPLEDYKK